MHKIGFNKPYITGRELEYIREALDAGKISGDGTFTEKCHSFFESAYGFSKCMLTTSCTDALEMSALLCGIGPGDEVIVPSFTFVSTANAFVLRGAKLVFADSREDEPNLDVANLESLITPKTKAVVPVHYAGVACDMDPLMELAQRHRLHVIEDNAHGIDSYYKGKPLGGIGDLGTFSFHESKNIISGEGGMIVINRPEFVKRAEIIREKGTDRAAFFRGEVDKYNWMDAGSSFLPSDLIAAFLLAQLEKMQEIQARRIQIWNHYQEGFATLAQTEKAGVPRIPDYATQNGHMYYLVCRSSEERDGLIRHLKEQDIYAVFHYITLHDSPYMRRQNPSPTRLPHAERYSRCLVRLPLHPGLKEDDVNRVIEATLGYFRSR